MKKRSHVTFGGFMLPKRKMLNLETWLREFTSVMESLSLDRTSPQSHLAIPRSVWAWASTTTPAQQAEDFSLRSWQIRGVLMAGTDSTYGHAFCRGPSEFCH